MVLRFVFSDKSTKTSPEFKVDAKMSERFRSEYLNGATSGELYNTSIEETGRGKADHQLKILFYTDPREPQKVVDEISRALHAAIPPYVSW